MAETMAKPSFQELIETVESLPIEDREMLVEIINKRIVEQRREELVADMETSLEAYRKARFAQELWMISSKICKRI